MRPVVFVAVAVICWVVPAMGQEPVGESKASAADAMSLVKELAADANFVLKELAAAAIFRELAARLPNDSQRAISARLELEYWYKHQKMFVIPPVRKPVNTKDGVAAEIVFLNAPAWSTPGTDFSMAFLLVENRVVDWASCWTHNRIVKQELLLEDVDGDRSCDVAFRASKGWHGLHEKRRHSRPGDERQWLYAYAITEEGLQSLFPSSDRDLDVKLSYHTANKPVVLEIKGFPNSLRTRQTTEFTLLATNTSDENIAIQPARWFRLEIDNAGYCLWPKAPDKRTELKPDETISQKICLVVDGTEPRIEMKWAFVPSNDAKTR